MPGLRSLTRPLGHGLVRAGTWLIGGSRESGEQLLSLVDDAAEQDGIEEEERELIRSVFELGETVVREVMVPRTDMITVDSAATIGDAVRTFLDHGVSRIPVIGEDADEVVGVLHLRDTLGAEPGTPAVSRAGAPTFVPESQKADELLRQMQRERFHLAMVVDEYGGVAGLVTMEDLIEELVGDIADESDRGVPEVVDVGGGRYRVAARYPAEDLGEVFGIELEDDDVDSVGGLLAKALGEVPAPHASAETNGLRLTVDRIERGRVITVIAQRDVALEAAEAAFPPVERKARR